MHVYVQSLLTRVPPQREQPLDGSKQSIQEMFDVFNESLNYYFQ